MKKILVIANSFGVDATRYLYGIARSEGKSVKVVTLHIGGCSLYRHYRNMLSEERAYAYYIDGIDSGLRVSLKEALLSDEWDVVTFQEASSGMRAGASYSPFIEALSEYARRLAPAAKQYMHVTWAYAEGCPRLAVTPHTSRAEMIAAKRVDYADAAEKIHADGMIPSLDAMCTLYDRIGDSAYRDGFHASLGIGRYMLGCLWFAVFFKKDITENRYRDFDVAVSEEDAALAASVAMEVARSKGFLS